MRRGVNENVFALIVREGNARGFLTHAQGRLEITDNFRAAFPKLSEAFGHRAVTRYVDALIATGATPSSSATCRPSMQQFVEAFVRGIQNETPFGSAAGKQIERVAGDIFDRYLVSTRALLGIVAIAVHRERFNTCEEDEKCVRA